MELVILNDLLIIFILAILVLVIFHKFRFPAILGYIFTGVLAGPYGFKLIKATHEVEILAEIGIIFLLFTIGIHFSIRNLAKIKRFVLLGGALQVSLTICFAYLVLSKLGFGRGEAVFIGFLLALSSTAIVLKVLEERAELESPQGRLSVAILIFQDVIIFPMILLTPLLAGVGEGFGASFGLVIIKGVAVVTLALISAHWLVPKILYQVVKTRSRELFLISIVSICFTVAWLTAYVGLSLSLGAFLAGLIISESEYSQQALGNVLPFRDLFLGLFFVSIGMLLDTDMLLQQPALIFIVTVIVLIVKLFFAALTAFVLGFPLRTCIIAGLILSQIGEFSFVLSGHGLKHGLLNGEGYQIFLAVSVVTMAVAPFIISATSVIGMWINRLPIPARMQSGLFPLNIETQFPSEQLKDHLIIVGYGINGRNVARAAKKAGVSYVVIEMNPETVRAERNKGEPIFYGDASEEPVLKHAHIDSARIVVIAIADAAAARQITQNCRRLCPNIYIIARTRFVGEVEPLYNLGADEVIPEEFETSVEIFTRVLTKYLVPRGEIEKFTSEIRAEGYEMFRSLSKSTSSLSDFELHLSNIEISTFRVGEGSSVAGKTIGELNLRKEHDVTVLLIRRDSQTVMQPDANTRLQMNDLITVLGEAGKIADFSQLLQKSG